MFVVLQGSGPSALKPGMTQVAARPQLQQQQQPQQQQQQQQANQQPQQNQQQTQLATPTEDANPTQEQFQVLPTIGCASGVGLSLFIGSNLETY